MQYLFLIYADRGQTGIISESEDEVYDRACLENDQALRERGSLLFAIRLQDHGHIATVRVQNSELSLTDGPSFKPEALLVGVSLVSARDLNEAVHLASMMPQAQRGPIEVRSAVALTGRSASAG